jgi:hypothetical protein
MSRNVRLVVSIVLMLFSAAVQPLAAQETAGEVVEAARERVDELAEQVDQSERAREVTAGVLKPIYLLAENMAFPAFHWVAFAIMVVGVVSFALQLTLGKLVVLAKMGFSLSEILSDALALVISLVGLVLTTQAAAENSTFTESPFAVLSSAVVGVLGGLVFYIWGQRQELQAVKGRTAEEMAAAKVAKK